MALSLCLLGCQSKEELPKGKGTQPMVSLSQVQEKLQQKDSFYLLFTQSGCISCKEFHVVVSSFLREYKIEIQTMNLTEQGTPLTSFLSKYFPSFSTTPSLYIIKDGIVQNQLDISMDITKEELKQWFSVHKIS